MLFCTVRAKLLDSLKCASWKIIMGSWWFVPGIKWFFTLIFWFEQKCFFPVYRFQNTMICWKFCLIFFCFEGEPIMVPFLSHSVFAWSLSWYHPLWFLIVQPRLQNLKAVNLGSRCFHKRFAPLDSLITQNLLCPGGTGPHIQPQLIFALSPVYGIDQVLRRFSSCRVVEQ